MDTVKLAGIAGPHAPQILYPGGRQPPPGPQAAHPPPSTRHEGSPYKTPISPPMGARAGAGGYPAYPPAAGETHVGGGRYIQQPYIYPREPHYIRPASDRPVMLPHGPRRPTILGSYGPYSRSGGAEIIWPYSHARNDLVPVVSGNPLAVSTTIDNSKRMKLSQPIKQENARVPLVIDTSENNVGSRESTYTPQVEAISPTLPSDPRDESPLRSTKDDLLKKIEKVDREIAKAESSIAKLRTKEKELETAALKGEGVASEEEQKEPKHQSVAQIIYAENRKRAEESHNTLVKLSPSNDPTSVLPLYHQPTDTEVYMANKRQYAGFKRRLLEYFKKRHTQKNERENNLTQTYSKLMTEWLKKVEKVENSKKHKEKVAKNRELFEKVFPELRKQREEKERFTRVGARVKSDAEMEEIMDGLQEQEVLHKNEDKKMRAYAVIPPILLEDRKRKYRYTNKNGIIEDPICEYKDIKNINIWTEQEKEIFREKYLLNPKNFVVIGSYLDRKSVSDCIQFYYSTKKKENYKMLVKRRIRRRQKQPNNQPVVEVLGIDSSRVLTRGAVKTQQTTATLVPGNPSNMTDANNISTSVNNTPATSPGPNVGLDLATTNVGPATSESSATTNSISNQEVREKDKENLSSSDSKSGDKIPSRRERLRKEDDKTKEAQDSSDDDNAAEHGKGGPHECLVCNTQLEHFGQSRPVGPGQAAQYGLLENQLPANPRVCTNCRCRHLRRRAQCPIPTCPTPKWRGKRLRPLPSRWSDLPAEVKDPIIREFQIPADITKCCSACHSRITKKLGPDAEEPMVPLMWPDDDVEALKSALREVGCHWSKVAEKIPSKTEGQCKSFYFNYKKNYKLDECVTEYRKARGKGDGPPTVTDEEESGSSTSSCDEATTVPPPPPTQDSASDTTSAPSPGPVINHNNIDEKRGETVDTGSIKEPLPRVPPPPPASVKEDYDSSATASADEGQVGRDSPPEVQHLPNPNERRPPASTIITKPEPPLPPSSIPASVKGPPNSNTNSSSSNVREIIFNTIEKSLEDKPSKEKQDIIPTIADILKTNYVPVRPQAPPSGQDFHPNQKRFTDPRAGLPPSDNTVFDPQEGQCEGLDLTVRKRDRSPQPQTRIPHPVHHQPIQPPPVSHPPTRPGSSPREMPTVTVRGGAELTIAKEAPPRAHNNASYNKPPPPAHDPWIFSDPHKSPAYMPDSRSLVHPPPTISTVVASGHSSITYATPIRQTQVHPPKLKQPSMAPPPPLTSARSQHAVSQTISSSARIPGKIDKSAPQPGSITHGTPLNPPGPIVSVSLTQAPNRFDLIPKQGIGKEGGSITQGTPIHPDHKRTTVSVYETRPGSGVEIIPRPALPTQYERDHLYRGPRPTITTAPPPTSYTYPNNYVYTRPPFSDSQISSRQIIAHDYQTSQQMIKKNLDKEPRLSPRHRDLSPQDARDIRNISAATTVSRIIDNRIDPRLDVRPVEHHRSLDIQRMDPRLDHRTTLDQRMVDRINASDHRFYPSSPHSSYQPQSQPPSTTVYIQDRSRPPSSPASGRDPTPASPTIDPASSPHDFRSPGVSTPTPPRQGVIQRHPTSKPPTHLAPPPSASPRDLERYSPRDSPRHVVGSDNFQTFVDVAVAQRSYQRDGRSKHHDMQQQPEGLEKVMAERYAGDKHDIRSPAMDVRVPPPQSDDRHYYDRRQQADYRVMSKNPEKKDIERVAAEGLAASFRKDEAKVVPQPKSNTRSTETLTAANLIDAIITHQINSSDVEGGDGRAGPGPGPVPGSQQRTIRREGEGGAIQVELDKRVRSPATGPPFKEKEIVMVEDTADTRPSPNPLNHKEGGMIVPLHSASHHQGSQPKSMLAHMDQVIHRAYTSDGRKIEASQMPYGQRPPFEITRSEASRSVVGSAVPPTVKVSQVPGGYEPWKMRHDKDGKDRLDSRSPHRPPQSSPAQSAHHVSAQHLAPDERQIIRIAQPPISPRTDPSKMRTPPSSQAGNFPVESISPNPSAAAPSDTNHTADPKEIFDFVKHRIAQVMRTPDAPEGEIVDDGRHHPSDTAPGSQMQHPPPPPPQQYVNQQNAHYDHEDMSKKRSRLETGDRPPSRPRSTGTDLVKERREDAPSRDDVADSPQSGEMVIDETPRDAHPPSSKSMDLVGGGKVVPKVDSTDRPGYPPVSAGNQYSYSFSGFRGPMPQTVGGPGVLPSTTSTTSSSNSSAGGRNPQGYGPQCEPVSDED